jgi:hypothetical protein
MKRLKVLFSIFLLIASVPFWRLLDYLGVSLPFEWPLSLGLIFWFAVFIAIPIKLLIPKIKTIMIVGLVLIFAFFAFNIRPYSNHDSIDSNLSHCSIHTFTGFAYPLRIILSEASRDDLEARNQMCWMRKLISEVPTQFQSEVDADTYTKNIESTLLSPELKYRSTLPLIAALYIKINTSTKDVIRMKEVYDSLHLWINHYTDEISERDYGTSSFPFSYYLKWEYGLIEKNWQKFVDNLLIESI